MDAKNDFLLIGNVITEMVPEVFIWVYLVVQSLLEGLTDRERLSDLHRWLNTLPEGLEDIFLEDFEYSRT